MKDIPDIDLKTWWVLRGGDFHGPTIETGTMPEAKLLPLLRELLKWRQHLDAVMEEIAEHHDISLKNVGKRDAWMAATDARMADPK